MLPNLANNVLLAIRYLSGRVFSHVTAGLCDEIPKTFRNYILDNSNSNKRFLCTTGLGSFPPSVRRHVLQNYGTRKTCNVASAQRVCFLNFDFPSSESEEEKQHNPLTLSKIERTALLPDGTLDG